MKLTHLVLTVALVAIPAASFAQTTPAEWDHIAARKSGQQDRIAQGDRSGQLTPHETAHLERRDASINREERGMRAADNGHLTTRDRYTLARQQNRESTKIYADKHNDRTDRGVAPE